jgi:N-methylhydantoinase A
VLRPLDEEAVRRTLAQLHADGVRDVAVVFLHSYVNPAHEQRVAALATEFPELAVTLSSDVDPEYREYERASTTVVTAALRPIVSGYLGRLEEGVRALGVAAPLLVMGSHGGMADLRAAAARPAGLIESGPASGLAAAAELARRLELERVLSLDMGGTTAKAGTVLHGAPETVAEFEAAGRTHSGRHVRGSGYPVRFPFLDLAEVSAGGGTIAHVDAGGALRVGPMSAGADPGPVCYGRGGADPTVTDAHLLLGRLNPAHLLGGAMPVDRDAAMRAMATLARRLDLDTTDLAAGIVRLISADMARALRIVSVERGHDPRRFTMVAFGGGGPLHACALAAGLGVPRAIVPPGPGLFSAAGLLTSPLKVALVRPVLTAATEAHPHELAALLAAMEAEAVSELTRQGATPATIKVAHTLDLRYTGQSYELAVPAEPGTGKWVDGLVVRFHERHREVYGYASPEHAVEIVAARTTATAPAGMATAPGPPPSAPAGRTPEPRSVRPVYFDEAGGFTATPVFWRDDLPVGTALAGPAVVEQYDSTTLLHPGWHLVVDRTENLVLRSVITEALLRQPPKQDDATVARSTDI